MPEAGQRAHVVEHGFAKARQLGKDIATVQGLAGADALVVLLELLPEVQAFLEIRPARGELAADGKVAAPGAPAARHMNAMFLFRALPEERAARGQQ